jgi:hypothetical protein
MVVGANRWAEALIEQLDEVFPGEKARCVDAIGTLQNCRAEIA